MKRMKLGAALAALMWPATDAVKISCWPNASTDWDTENTCGANDVKGATVACGDTLQDLCHLTMTIDNGATPDAGSCGKCYKMSWGGGPTVKYGKVIGVEEHTADPATFAYRTNAVTATVIEGSSMDCSSDAVTSVDVTFEEEDCPVQASCVPDSTGDWDPDGECSGLPGAEAACGDDWSNPCTVLKAFDTAQSDDGHCGVCVTFKFDDSGDKALYGKIVGSEASSMWDYRVNDDSFVKIGGETGKCGSFEDVIAVLDAKEHVCPTEMTCIAPTTDWDTLNHCSTGTLVGDETTCGDSADDPCHMMATYDDDGDNPKPTAPERCGECMKLTYGEFAENEKYAKIIGLEEVTGAARDWEYRLNQVVFEAIHGSAPTCETTKAYITAEKVDCPVELTCWPESTSDWDPETTNACTGMQDPSDDANCGDTAENPCTLTKGFAEGAPDTTHCGQCVEFVYEDGGDQTLHGIIIGSEETPKWAYRVNKDAYDNTIGGTGECGAHHQVRAVKSVKDVDCAGVAKVTCFPDSTSDWDLANYCTTSAIAGNEAVCGETAADPCHLVATYDSTNTPPADAARCGECVKIKYKIGETGAEKERYGKIIGVESISLMADREWEYRVNKKTFDDMKGDTSGVCGETTSAITVADEACALEMTCWAAGGDAASWDPDKTCDGVEDLPAVSDSACGATAEDPCTLTMGFKTAPEGKDHCGKCVTIKYQSGTDAETSLYGVIVGGQVTEGWTYRANKDTYDNKLGGSGACGEYHSVAAVDSASDPAECPTEGDDETTTSPADPSSSDPSGSVRAGVTLALAVAALAAA